MAARDAVTAIKGPDGERGLPEKAGRRRRALGQAGIAAAVFWMTRRTAIRLRWLCGQPGDGVLVITAGGRSVLAAWDAILASRMACADAVLPYTEFGRSLPEFLSRILPELEVPAGAPLRFLPSPSGRTRPSVGGTAGLGIRCPRAAPMPWSRNSAR
jgi:hypothetical protein